MMIVRRFWADRVKTNLTEPHSRSAAIQKTCSWNAKIVFCRHKHISWGRSSEVHSTVVTFRWRYLRLSHLVFFPVVGSYRCEFEQIRKENFMCYNCGCQMPDNDMGNPKNITNKTFEEAAKAAGQNAEQAKKNALELLQKTTAAKK